METQPQQLITVKSKFGEDLRRFSLPLSCRYEELCAHLAAVYSGRHVDKEPGSLVVKYVDDEGDLISITSDEELSEAFRLSKDNVPPILRLIVSASSASTTATATATVSLVNEPAADKRIKITIEKGPLPATTTASSASAHNNVLSKEEKEYPPLADPSQWDPPSKQPQQAQQRPRRVVDETLANCTETSLEVAKYSKEISQQTLLFSESIKAALEQQKESDREHSQLCSTLSSDIAQQCSQLCRRTAELCGRLSTLQRQQQYQAGSLSPGVAGELSSQSTALCSQLADATLRLSLGGDKEKKEEEEEEEGPEALVERLKRQSESMRQLSQRAVDECRELANRTREESLRTSSDIRRIIMEL
ncbi:hypothetical protein QOT17_006433 [Balamuthia mandrillaris]